MKHKKHKKTWKHTKEQLEKIVERQQQRVVRMERALTRIEAWEMPKTDLFWDGAKMRPMSYAAAFGSNGERDVVRNIARSALSGGTCEPELYYSPEPSFADKFTEEN